MSTTPAADFCWLVGIWTEASGSVVQRRQTSIQTQMGLKRAIVMIHSCPDIGDIRRLLKVLLVNVAQVLEAPDNGDIRDPLNLLDVSSLGSTLRHLRAPLSAILAAYSTFCWSNTARLYLECLQLCVALTTGAGLTAVESSYDQCSLVLVRLFLV